MTSSLLVPPRPSSTKAPTRGRSLSPDDATALRTGQVLVAAHSEGLTGGQVSAQLYMPMAAPDLWEHLSDYPRWSEYFPNIACSRELVPTASGVPRVYQVGQKSLMGIPTAGDLYLQVHESPHEQIQFRLERGIFSSFEATLRFQPWRVGVLLTYTIQVTLAVPLPWFILRQGIQDDLPHNLRHMRDVICGTGAVISA
ncbi:MAG: SRPBCC family protein [Leptolyngbyaceae cyanobacterium]